jgi:hypothetical protein
LVGRRSLGVVASLLCVASLSACSLLPGIPVAKSFSSGKHPDAVMQHIADAVRHDDATALEKLFSATARKNAADLGGELKYFLSVFPSGKLTWEIEDGGPGSAEQNQDGYTEELYAFYEVSAAGKKYDLYFADISASTKDPKSVGLYALGVQPYTANPLTASAAAKRFFVWANSHLLENGEPTGTPGAYVPQQ